MSESKKERKRHEIYHEKKANVQIALKERGGRIKEGQVQHRNSGVQSSACEILTMHHKSRFLMHVLSTNSVVKVHD